MYCILALRTLPGLAYFTTLYDSALLLTPANKGKDPVCTLHWDTTLNCLALTLLNCSRCQPATTANVNVYVQPYEEGGVQ